MTCYSKNKLCSTIVHGKHPWQSMVSTKNKVRSSFYEVIFEKVFLKSYTWQRDWQLNFYKFTFAFLKFSIPLYLPFFAIYDGILLTILWDFINDFKSLHNIYLTQEKSSYCHSWQKVLNLHILLTPFSNFAQPPFPQLFLLPWVLCNRASTITRFWKSYFCRYDKSFL